MQWEYGQDCVLNEWANGGVAIDDRLAFKRNANKRGMFGVWTNNM